MAKQIFTGKFHAVARNNLDGTYPKEWRTFYVITDPGNPNVHLSVDTGGARDRLLEFTDKMVSVEGWKVTDTLAQGDLKTLKGSVED